MRYHFGIIFIISFSNKLVSISNTVINKRFIQTNTANGQLSKQTPINILDVFMAILFIFFFMFEWIGDEQQWEYQSKKYKWLVYSKNSKKH